MKKHNIDDELTDESGNPTDLKLSESDIEFLADLFLPLIKVEVEVKVGKGARP